MDASVGRPRTIAQLTPGDDSPRPSPPRGCTNSLVRPRESRRPRMLAVVRASPPGTRPPAQACTTSCPWARRQQPPPIQSGVRLEPTPNISPARAHFQGVHLPAPMNGRRAIGAFLKTPDHAACSSIGGRRVDTALSAVAASLAHSSASKGETWLIAQGTNPRFENRYDSRISARQISECHTVASLRHEVYETNPLVICALQNEDQT